MSRIFTGSPFRGVPRTDETGCATVDNFLQSHRTLKRDSVADAYVMDIVTATMKNNLVFAVVVVAVVEIVVVADMIFIFMLLIKTIS